jgi:Zn-dependent peptidase ImmA (M78 family)
MRILQNKRSPWGSQVYFTVDEFETMMDCLRDKSGQDCFQEGSGVDVDLVLLKAFEIEPDFVPLPSGILGRTRFWPDGRAVIEVSRDLADAAEGDDIARKRVRTTLAHEGGHVCCHRGLFLRDVATFSLFGHCDTDDSRSTILCREETVVNRHYQGEWWEYQANRCMAALLMPKGFLREKVGVQLSHHSLPTFDEAIKAEKAVVIIRNLCDVFDVSQQVMLYRLQDLGYVPDELQRRLNLQ